jgi:hypothetical protein
LGCFKRFKMLKILTKLMKVTIKKEGKRHLHIGTQHSDKIVHLVVSKMD